MKIVVTGSIAYDYLMSFPGKFTDSLVADQLHTVSLSFLVDTLNRQRGGTAPNIAYTLALLGGHPSVMATAGQDFGDYRTWLESHGVDTTAIIEIENDFCASFFVNTDQAQNQIASFYTGAMAHAADRGSFGMSQPCTNSAPARSAMIPATIAKGQPPIWTTAARSGSPMAAVSRR